MSGGTISGNSASSGGGVYVFSGGTFIKQSGGTIYGSNESDYSLRNTATYGADYGHAVYVESSPVKIRNTTAGTGVTLDSAVSGSAGGWESTVAPSTGISNISYSTVSGSSTWTLQSDGRRVSPAISHSSTTKARVDFTSSGTDAFIVIELAVSSEASYDVAFISTLDNPNATSSSGYFTGSAISGTQSITVSIPVSTAGSHFIEIGYQKDSTVSHNSDCAWFKVLE
jgi:hypothetical protein